MPVRSCERGKRETGEADALLSGLLIGLGTGILWSKRRQVFEVHPVDIQRAESRRVATRNLDEGSLLYGHITPSRRLSTYVKLIEVLSKAQRIIGEPVGHIRCV